MYALKRFGTVVFEYSPSDVSLFLCAETAPIGWVAICATLVAVTHLIDILVGLGLALPGHAVLSGSRERRGTRFSYRL